MAKKDPIQRHDFSRIEVPLEIPDLLEVQLKSFRDFLQKDVPPDQREHRGLQQVFNGVFPIVDNREEHILEFVDYFVEAPKYSVEECKERGVSYTAPLKAVLRLSTRADSGDDEEFDQTIESDVYLGNLPMMTDTGTFIINGAERVIVSQLHRSPGVFFSNSVHPNGTMIYSARIIPFRGSWIEFTTDINNAVFVYIDRRKKFPVTTFLRAIGFSTDDQILAQFGFSEDVPLSRKNIENYFGRTVPVDIIDEESGEILAEKDGEFDEEMMKRLKRGKVRRVPLMKRIRGKDNELSFEVLQNTFNKDRTSSRDEALEFIYREMRNGDPPDVETALKLLQRMFFDDKRYDLGAVGRYRINVKLDLKVDESTAILTADDIIAIIKYVLDLKNGKRQTDDIDHLGNRRVRTVGEQLANQFSVAFSRMGRTIKERMNVRDTEKLQPQDLVNVRTVSSVINTFFGTNQLSQFMDQVNPLTELTHKRRLSALGPGGLTRERAGFEVRDVHYTHYGRLCPIETPEGPNIGLISSLTTYARFNQLGFVETPYRVVKNGRVTKQIKYLSADDEDKFVIAQANAPLSEDGSFARDRIKCRHRADYPVKSPDEIDLMDVAPTQMVSLAAALIPFLEHDDANRALMGSNMQRQAVPLLVPEAPVVGTGMESRAARDSRSIITADEDGEVVYVDANKIVMKARRKGVSKDRQTQLPPMYRTYNLRKFERSNQDTSINQRPLVEKGQFVRAGRPLADGPSTERGDLALGRNVLVAFMPWHGFNFEDAVIISERIVRDDVFTSVRIEELELQVRETKRGKEELTREIPNVSEEATKDLDENGIIRCGAIVQPNDILVGKVTPKGETDLTPEDKLLKAIFGDKAGDVKDASLKAHPGMYGIVIDTKLFSRKTKDPETRRRDKEKVALIEERAAQDVLNLKQDALRNLAGLLTGRTSKGIVNPATGEELIESGIVYTDELISGLDVDAILGDIEWADDEETSLLANHALREYRDAVGRVQTKARNDVHKVQVGDELPSGILQLAKVYIAQRRKLSVGDKMAGRHGNKGVVGKIVPTEDMPFLEDGTPVDIILNPLGVPSRMNIGQIFETVLGWAGKRLGRYYSTSVFDGASMEDVVKELNDADVPENGQVQLFDGRSGELFHQKTTVGYIYMLKLSHLVDDKIHARSIGPYSLITQQPLGGKAQFGGQRFGEMEVWALEAYGASYLLQEMLTVKSDDVAGRSRTYEAMVKGENLPPPGVPESFNVLINELKGLALDVKLD
ncbi:MAG: DNA-directed RNA polymerase subunit beta [Calditrichaeota bacterium]|nr:DNA-directed RNA polymerase subunit beta [Calditrichota bacterium]